MKKITSKCVKSNTKLKIYFIETFVEDGNTKLKVTHFVLLLILCYQLPQKFQ